MMSAAHLTRKQAVPAARRRKVTRVKDETAHPACCDQCRDKRNTLFDLPEGLLCLPCAFGFYDEMKRAHVNLLIRACVAGTINIERRRRAIAKRRAQSRRAA